MSDNRVLNTSKELNGAILESDEYQKYCLYKKELGQFPELKNKVQEFRRRTFEIELDGRAKEECIEEKNRLTQEYRDVLENPLAASYLNAELSFCKMLQRVTRNICTDIDLELEFI